MNHPKFQNVQKKVWKGPDRKVNTLEDQKEAETKNAKPQKQPDFIQRHLGFIAGAAVATFLWETLIILDKYITTLFPLKNFFD